MLTVMLLCAAEMLEVFVDLAVGDADESRQLERGQGLGCGPQGPAKRLPHGLAGATRCARIGRHRGIVYGPPPRVASGLHSRR